MVHQDLLAHQEMLEDQDLLGKVLSGEWTGPPEYLKIIITLFKIMAMHIYALPIMSLTLPQNLVKGQLGVIIGISLLKDLKVPQEHQDLLDIVEPQALLVPLVMVSHTMALGVQELITSLLQ